VTRKEVIMDPELKWMIRVGLAVVGLYSLLQTGARRGWI
jgi:hypothetical protein